METPKARIVKDFSAWVRSIVEEEGTQIAAAVRMGVKQEQVSRWLNGKVVPSLTTMLAASKRAKRALPPSLLDLAHLDPAKPRLFSNQDRRYVTLRREAHRIAAGQALDWRGDPENAPTYAFDVKWFHRRFGVEPDEKTTRFQVFRIAEDEKGESMEPTIPRGSVILADAEGDQKEGSIYVVRHPEEGGLMVKRVYKSRDGLIFESDNKAHRPIVVRMDPDRAWDGSRKFIIGKVVWVGFEL